MIRDVGPRPILDPTGMSDRDELARLVEELREAVRARDEFLVVAAHELRNPMHALLLQVSTTLNTARRHGDAELVGKLERIMRTVDRYVQRATALLDVSRINAGRFQLQIASVDLAEVVREVVESYAQEAAFQGVTLHLTLPESLRGRWDRLATEQIVANLVSNAVKYGAGAPVDVTLAREDTAMARLTVQDRGIGISKEDQARIFERFEQVVTGQFRSGFGVGLWLVRALVEAHGGAITVESTPGEGSTFTVRLPIDAVSSKDVPRP